MTALQDLARRVSELEARLDRTSTIATVSGVKHISKERTFVDVVLDAPYQGIEFFELEVLYPVTATGDVNNLFGFPHFNDAVNPPLHIGDRVLVLIPSGQEKDRAYVVGRFF